MTEPSETFSSETFYGNADTKAAVDLLNALIGEISALSKVVRNQQSVSLRPLSDFSEFIYKDLPRRCDI